MTMKSKSTETQLYFTAEKVCLGSYDDVAESEQQTKQSYWASDFFQLPPAQLDRHSTPLNYHKRQWLDSSK
jgi:hypothetical protein